MRVCTCERTRALPALTLALQMAQYGFAIEAPLPLVLGCDMAGVVEEVGDGMEGVKPGDEIFSFTGVGKPGRGTFATHCIVKDKLFFRKPSHLTLEQAASLPLGLLTAARALFDVLRLNAPTAAAEGRERDEFVLVSAADDGMCVRTALCLPSRVIAGVGRIGQRGLHGSPAAEPGGIPSRGNVLGAQHGRAYALHARPSHRPPSPHPCPAPST